MKAAVLNTVPGDLSIENVDIDKPGPNEVLLRTAAAGICHSDLHFADGSYPQPTPCVLGHESAGIVEQVGSDVRYVKPGDHVISCVAMFCGECRYCLAGRPSLCNKRGLQRPKGAEPRLSNRAGALYQFANLSSFAEYMLVHEHALVKIRPDMPLEVAALLGCGVTTGLGAVFRTARVEPGSTVAVLGCGGIGLSAIQGAAIAGAGRIIAVDMLSSKLELARRLGATDALNPKEGDVVKRIIELTDGGVDYSFEAIGLKATAEQAFAMLARSGTATIIGMIPMGTTIELPGYRFLDERKVQGSNMGSTQFRVDIPRFVDFYLSGKLKLDDLISERIALEQVNAGIAELRKGEVARSVVVFA